MRRLSGSEFLFVVSQFFMSASREFYFYMERICLPRYPYFWNVYLRLRARLVKNVGNVSYVAAQGWIIIL